MDEALIGLIGVAAGALATTGAQIVLARRQLRMESVTAARLLWIELVEARDEIQTAIDEGRWAGLDDLDRQLEVWREQRTAFARAVHAVQFHTVAAAFAHIARAQRIRNEARIAGKPDEGFSIMAASLPGWLQVVEAAKTIAWRVSERPSDRLLDRWRRQALPSASDEPDDVVAT